MEFFSTEKLKKYLNVVSIGENFSQNSFSLKENFREVPELKNI